jgi:glycosyltransferase involved in cell wall biosynthesis
MRVTHVITRLIVGGAQENTLATVAGLGRIPGVDVHLISGPSTGPEGSLEAEAKNLTVVPELVRPVHPLKDWLALRKLEKLFREEKPDLVHTHSSKAGILGRLAARRAGVPIIIHTVHGPSFGKFQSAPANFIFRNAERLAARATTHFVVVADAMKEQCLAAGIGRPEQYTKIFSGFTLEPFLSARNDLDLRARLGLAPGDFIIGKIARLFKLKGHDDLFAVAPELIRQNPKIKFLIIGDGPWRGRFENLTESLGVKSHFVFTGLVRPEEVPKYTGVINALAHLSLREGLARALPQAMAAAKPVVAYDCDGAREACQDGRTGFLIRAGDLTTLKNRLLQLAGDPALCKTMGETGQQFARENFPVEKMVREIYNLYVKLAANH